ncbi:MAG: hypothetical protein JXB26_02695 [Candidatus Aminicenantes bacterium]|nr:hypothetical protein [Candidatus Aminicenantes bacterium]
MMFLACQACFDCHCAKEVVNLTPIFVVNPSSLAFEGTMISLNEGTVIGDRSEGAGHKAYEPLSWNKNIFIMSEILDQAALEEMLSAGYKIILSKEKENRQIINVSFSLMLEVVEISCYSFGVQRGGYTEAYVRLDGILHSKGGTNRVFKFKSEGYGKTEDDGPEWTIMEAFRAAVRNLLADASFAGVLTERDVSFE